MPFAKLLSIVLSPLLLICVEDAYAESSPKPLIKFDQASFDFGAVAEGVRVKHDFGFKNAGNADLVIQKVIPACGCTAATADSAPVPAGQSGVIHVEFDTSGFSGEKLKTVRIYTNDMDNLSPMLSIKGTVEPDVSIEPRRISFEEVVKGQPAEQEITIKARPGSGITLTGVKSLSPTLTLEELSGGATERRYRVRLDTDAAVGEVRERLVLTLTGGRAANINIPVYALIKGNVELKPSVVSFGIIEGKEPIERSVKLENLGPKDVQITSLNAKDPALKVSFKPIKPGKIYVVQVTLDPTKVSADLRSSVDISTDSEDTPLLSLNVYGVQPPKSKP